MPNMSVPVVPKFFNTAGPGIPGDHYMIDPLRRIDYENISALIDQKRYFVLHAPRQTGKTTSLLAMVERINAEGRYRCAYLNVELAQTARSDVNKGMKAILSSLEGVAGRYLGCQLSGSPAEIVARNDGNAALVSELGALCCTLDRPLVLFIDEIDALVGDTLVSVLRQLRTGYTNRPQSFPISVILCGVRDVRDYRISTSDGDVITGGSCFNIKAESLRLGDFSGDEIRELYLQHTEATGQTFEENIYPRVWELTRGQPWLVNALAHEATWRMKDARDRSVPITLARIDQAAENLIIGHTTHLDQLIDKLSEPRIRHVIEPLFSGDATPRCLPDDDVSYVLDLGLVKLKNGIGNMEIANAIYKEAIPRKLAWATGAGASIC
ncbi:MAG: ATP-binding protein [Synergistaceae bacterium]|jgi:hypothetical protein|nr:ATP-binding protein [Synergistaceae bacterium]